MKKQTSFVSFLAVVLVFAGSVAFGPRVLAAVLNFPSGTINSSGNMGIGTTNPGAGYRLDVQGGSINTSGGVYAAGASGFYSATYVAGARNPIWRFGNADGYGISYFQGSAGIGSLDTIGFHFGTATAAASLLQVNQGGGGTVTVNGSFGVGTTGPGYKLDVAGAGTFEGNILHGIGTPITTTDAANKSYVDSAVGGVASSQWTTGLSLIYYNGGNVGIGTASPAEALDVNSGTIVAGANTGERINFGAGSLGFNRRVSNGGIYTGNAYAYQIQHTQNTTAASDYLAFQVYSPAGASVTPYALAITGAANVGIGTSGPVQKLSVAGEITANEGTWGSGGYSFIQDGSQDTGMFSPSDGVIDFYDNQVHSINISAGGAVKFYQGITFPDGTTQSTAASGGSVTNASNVSSGSFGSGTGGGAYTFPSNLTVNGVLYTAGSVTNYGALTIRGAKAGWSGINFQDGSGNNQATLMVSGNTVGVFSQADNTWNWYWSGGTLTTGTVPAANVGAGTFSGNYAVTGTLSANKMTANTFDPIYTIGGTNYATYLSGMTGVKEETAGTIDLKKGADGDYAATIDFAKEPAGSDIWLFAKATNLTHTMDQLVVMLTPSFAGNAWYEKDATAGTLTIYATPVDGHHTVAGNYEVSYRLTAPRFDAAQWGNVGDPNAKGLLINN